jgi:hypothetical protein
MDKPKRNRARPRLSRDYCAPPAADSPMLRPHHSKHTVAASRAACAMTFLHDFRHIRPAADPAIVSG